MEELKTIEKEASILFGVKKENQLKIPNGYFKSMETRLIQISDEKPVIYLNYKKILLTVSSIAAILIIGVSIYQNNNTNQDINSFNTSFNQLTVATFEEEMLDIEESDLPIDFEDAKEIDISIISLDKL